MCTFTVALLKVFIPFIPFYAFLDDLVGPKSSREMQIKELFALSKVCLRLLVFLKKIIKNEQKIIQILFLSR